ncbi:enoyl-CoA hydratase [Caballeronia novacaledonica]|uniref:Enoyl-CoA hydratase n=1 Tax=Caballeronia novacaledonica TaxID=1544861 RepID=A0A2U3I3F9_9BURK|nr:crotonase/enoyl-CoA hydratase family protein [Caballeronia novacaledonica]SPB14599.1 enoyl-CoA hydratase [Caballeronia novacaledonica]
MSEPFFKLTREGAILIATMNRPQTRNALTDHDVVPAFTELCEEVNVDASVRVLVLTGAGPAFSSGGNLKTIRERFGSGRGAPHESRTAYRDGIQRIPLALCNLEVPTIAAVNGPAYGAGNDLACMCDIRIACESAVFAESFVKLGLIPGDGGAWLLPRVVGMSRACEMSFTGDPIDATTALAWGLVSRVVPAEHLLPSALDLARRIAANSGPALRMTKRLLIEGRHARLDSLLDQSAALQALAHQTTEHESALDAALARFGQPRAATP